jgi:hypothetical protein
VRVTRFCFLRLGARDDVAALRTRIAQHFPSAAVFVPHDDDAHKAWDLAVTLAGAPDEVAEVASALSSFFVEDPSVVVAKAWTFSPA